MGPGNSLKLKVAAWFLWLGLVVLLTAKPFLWQVEYYRNPGNLFYSILLVALPVFVVCCLGYVVLRKSALWKYEPLVLSCMILLIPLIYQPVATLICSLLFICCVSWGSRLSSLCNLNLSEPLELLTIGFALGSALFIPVLFALGLAHAYYAWVFILIIALSIIFLHREALRALSAIRQSVQLAMSSPGLKDSLPGIAAVFFAVALICALMVFLTPSIAFDPLAFHLPQARYFSSQHALEPLSSVSYSYFPQGFEVLMTVAYLLGGQAAAQMISPLFFLFFLLVLFQIARVCGLSVVKSYVGIACVALLPFLHWTGSNSKNDMALAFFQAAALYCYLRWQQSRSSVWIAFGTIFLSSTFSIKHVALFGAIPIGLLFLWAISRHAKPIQLACLTLVLFTASCSFWYVRTYLAKGNPLYPEAAGRAVSDSVSSHGGGLLHRVSRYGKLPWNILFNGTTSFESPLPNPCGIVLVAFAPLILFRRRITPEQKACWLFILLYLAYWSTMISTIRYALVPIGLLVIFLIANVIEFYDADWGGYRNLVRGSVIAVLTGTLVFACLGISLIEINVPQILLLAGRIDRTEFLRTALRTYPSLEAIQKANVTEPVFGINNCSREYSPNPDRFYCALYGGQVRDEENLRAQVLASGSRFLIVDTNGSMDNLLRLIHRDGSYERIYSDRYFSVFHWENARK